MGRIADTFDRLREQGWTGFIPYITAGDPDLSTTEALVVELERRGSDVIELGVPFSDPIADGPVNQASAQRALRHRVSLSDILQMVGRLREKTEVPIVLFTYYNPVHRYGLERFVSRAADVGVDGVLALDLPPEESGDYVPLMRNRGLDTIYLIAPNSPEARIRLISSCATGFVYYVSRTGVTGEREQLSDTIGPMVERIREYTRNPVAVGFGVSRPDQAAEIAGYADAVVVGSAIVRRIQEAEGDPNLVSQIGDFVETLARPLREG